MDATQRFGGTSMRLSVSCAVASPRRRAPALPGRPMRKRSAGWRCGSGSCWPAASGSSLSLRTPKVRRSGRTRGASNTHSTFTFMPRAALWPITAKPSGRTPVSGVGQFTDATKLRWGWGGMSKSRAYRLPSIQRLLRGIRIPHAIAGVAARRAAVRACRSATGLYPFP